MPTSILHPVIRPPVACRISLSTAYRCSWRKMATKAQRKEWLAIIPDQPDVLEIRKKVKGDHYKGIKPLIASGTLPAGGAIFEKHPVDGEPALFKGSVIVYAAENAEQVREIIHNDVYARSGVWDLDKVQIVPYAPAVREPLKRD